MTNSSYEQIFKELERKTGYKIVYNTREIDQGNSHSISVDNKSITDVLNVLFDNTEITYRITNKHIALFKREIKTITGTVTDEHGESVIGANIVVKGTTNGIFTDADGKFSLKVSEGDVLLISYVWLNDYEKAVSDINKVRSRANASLATAAEMSIGYVLDERARELFAEEFRKAELTCIAFVMAEKGINGYSSDNFSEKNFWYDRIMEKNEFYRAGDILWGPNIYKMSPFHVLWPIPANAIDSNLGGVINQNKGYVGVEKNQPPLTVIDDRQ